MISSSVNFSQERTELDADLRAVRDLHQRMLCLNGKISLSVRKCFVLDLYGQTSDADL
jgi:hypothetical protein